MYSRSVKTIAIAVALCIGAGAACSYKFVRGPVRTRHLDERPDCARTSWLPYADIGLAAGAAAGGAWLLLEWLRDPGETCDGETCDGSRGLGVGPALAATAVAFLSGASAYDGFRKTKRCREARKLYLYCAPLVARVRWERDYVRRLELAWELPGVCVPPRSDANMVETGLAADDAVALGDIAPRIVEGDDPPQDAPPPEGAGPAGGAGDGGASAPDPPVNPFITGNLCVNQASEDAAEPADAQKIVWRVALPDATSVIEELTKRAAGAGCELDFKGKSAFIATCGDAIFEAEQRDAELTFRTTGMDDVQCRELMQRTLVPAPSSAGQGADAAKEETPAEETPAEETPAEETPAVETPAVETPAEETPAEETPAEETPAEETPAVEG